MSVGWSWGIMSNAWFYLYNKGGDMTIDFTWGTRYTYGQLGEFDPWKSNFKVAGGMRIDFFDADGAIIHSYYGPDTVVLGMVFPFDGFEIFEV